MASPASFLMFVLLLLLLPTLYLFLFWSNSRIKKRSTSAASEELPDLPPGPAKLPIIGNLHQLAGAGKPLHRSLWELSKRHGSLMHLKLGQVPAFVISSADLAKEVLKTHDADCLNRPSSISSVTLAYGNSDITFAPYGERWKERRRICIEEFLSNKKVASLRPVIEEEITRTMRCIASRAEDSPVVDVSGASCFLINSIVCKTAFGRSHHDDGANREKIQFHAILKNFQDMFAGFFVGDYLPQLGWVDVLTGMRGRIRRTYLEFESFFKQLIKEQEGSNSNGGNILDALLHVQRDTKNLTENEIKAMIMDVFIAGTDTSSTIMEWTMTELMRHPEAMRRAQDEVRGCVGRKGKVDESDLRQLRYLKTVIKETMRLHPPAPLLIPRESIRGFKLQGYDVAPKATIFINTFAIGRDPASWERPDEFVPERFMDNSGGIVELRSHHEFKLLPFGEGRRSCPGMSLGLLMTELGLANLLYCFNWSLPTGMTTQDLDMGEDQGITVHRSAGLRLVAAPYRAVAGEDLTGEQLRRENITTGG